MGSGILAVELPETGFGKSLEALVIVVQLEQTSLDFGIEVQQSEVGGDGGAGGAAATRKVSLGVGLSRVEQLPEAEGLLDGVGVLDHLQAARFSLFSTDSDVGRIDPMSLKNRHFVPYQPGFSERNVRATNRAVSANF